MGILDSPLAMTLVNTGIRGATLPPPPVPPDIAGLTGLRPPVPGQQPGAAGGGLQSPFNPDVDIFGHPLQQAALAAPGREQVGTSTSGRPIYAQEPDPFQMPTMAELDALGKEAVIGQFDADLERFEGSEKILDRQNELSGTGGILETEKTDQLKANAAERVEVMDQFNQGLVDLDALPDEVRKEVYGNVESLKKYISGRIDTNLGAMRAEYDGMRDVLESMNEEHFAQARDRTAEMLQATGNGVMSQIGNTVRTMQADPRFQEMSADQQSVSLATVRYAGAAKIGSTLAEVGAQERARLDLERVTRDQMLASFDEKYLGEAGATRRTLVGAEIAQVGAAQREAGLKAADALIVRDEQKRLTRLDMANFTSESRMAEQTFILGQNQLILQGNRDAFTMQDALVRPVLESGLMNHAVAIQSHAIGLLTLIYNNDLNANAVQTGYVQAMLEPLDNFIGYQMQKELQPEPAGTDWGDPIGAGITGGFKLLDKQACIDGTAKLETPEGRRSLNSLHVGDLVKSADGSYQKIVRMDHGLAARSRANDFVEISRSAKGNKLILTEDHVVEGAPARDWPWLLKPVAAVACGDILLEDGSDYLANGFRIKTTKALCSLHAALAAHDRTRQAEPAVLAELATPAEAN